jgi:hypothetical protein
VRPASEATSVTVLAQTGGSKRYRKLKTVTTDRSGYWSIGSAARAAHWRVRWVSPGGGVYLGPPIEAR